MSFRKYRSLVIGCLLGCLSFTGVGGPKGYVYGLEVDQKGVNVLCKVFKRESSDVLFRAAYEEILNSVEKDRDVVILFESSQNKLTVCTGKDLRNKIEVRQKGKVREEEGKDKSLQEKIQDVRNTTYAVAGTVNAADYTVRSVNSFVNSLKRKR